MTPEVIVRKCQLNLGRPREIGVRPSKLGNVIKFAHNEGRNKGEKLPIRYAREKHRRVVVTMRDFVILASKVAHNL
jgi:hypothetical protein